MLQQGGVSLLFLICICLYKGMKKLLAKLWFKMVLLKLNSEILLRGKIFNFLKKTLVGKGKPLLLVM